MAGLSSPILPGGSALSGLFVGMRQGKDQELTVRGTHLAAQLSGDPSGSTLAPVLFLLPYRTPVSSPANPVADRQGGAMKPATLTPPNRSALWSRLALTKA